MLSSDESKEKISSIAQQVTLITKSHDADVAKVAEDKRAKWNNIPLWLAFTCKGIKQFPYEEGMDLFQPMPICTPVSNRQLENYAAVAVSVQNVMLALHEKDVGTKWCTGPVMQSVSASVNKQIATARTSEGKEDNCAISVITKRRRRRS
jgi:hypothetical protein